MGGKSTSDSQSTSQLTPYAPLQGALSGAINGITGLLPNMGLSPTETGALNTLQGNAAAGNPYASAIGNTATNMLNGGGANAFNGLLSGAYDGLKNSLTPIANGAVNTVGLLGDQLNTMKNDIVNNVNGTFAASGRDPTGNAAAPQAIARGVAQGAAPILNAANNADLDRRTAAASTLYNAANTTGGLLSQNNQAANANSVNGVSLAQNALDAANWGPNSQLAIEAQRRGIPMQNLAGLLQMILPSAAQFGTQSGTSHTENQMSGAQQFGLIANGIGNIAGSMFRGPVKFA